MTNGDSGNSDITKVAASVSAVIGVFAALAVTGVMAEAQRNHGYLILAALFLVLVGAVLWIATTLITWGRVTWVPFVLKCLALAAFAVGLGAGMWAIRLTQANSERPSVSSTWDSAHAVVTVTATAHGLRSDSRVVIVVSGFKGTPDNPKPQKNPPTLYFAVVGPDAGGDVNNTAEIPVPPKYTLVGIRAWTGNRPNSCRTEELVDATEIPQHDRVGCFLLQVRERALTASKPKAAGARLR